ncbi:MAG: hypothetical protein KW793_02645 [Candidatus Doudnabacteria bacterium]|nr:hypothetical protein [Candidatus Doudnabacteria bacterium]
MPVQMDSPYHEEYSENLYPEDAQRIRRPNRLRRKKPSGRKLRTRLDGKVPPTERRLRIVHDDTVSATKVNTLLRTLQKERSCNITEVLPARGNLLNQRVRFIQANVIDYGVRMEIGTVTGKVIILFVTNKQQYVADLARSLWKGIYKEAVP